MAEYKFTYFNVRGLGEHVRLLFVAAGVDFEDDKVPFEKWTEYKPKFKYGQVPILRINSTGKELSQSLAISRYLGKTLSFVAEDPFLDARADEIVDIATELRLEFRPWLLEKDEGYKAELKKVWTETTAPKYYKWLEELVSETPGNFISGDKPVWQDFFLANWIEIWEELALGPDFLTGYPALKKLREAVFEIPAIKNYVASRPKTFV